MTKIVITGGPCAGKSTSLSRLSEYLSGNGFKVLTLSETSTELMNAGITPWECKAKSDYQRVLFALQKQKERSFEEAARSMCKDKTVILCDRGLLDGKAYITDEEYKSILDGQNTDEKTILASYDAVFHLESAAKGVSDFYTTSNNSARTESAEEAKALDDRIRQIWSGHKNYTRIKSARNFEEKIKELEEAVCAFLGGIYGSF